MMDTLKRSQSSRSGAGSLAPPMRNRQVSLGPVNLPSDLSKAIDKMGSSLIPALLSPLRPTIDEVPPSRPPSPFPSAPLFLFLSRGLVFRPIPRNLSLSRCPPHR